MIPSEVSELLASVSDAFPGRLEPTEGMLRIWSTMLADVTAAEAGEALMLYLADGPPHPPSISDIRRRVADRAVGGPDPAEAWEEVRKAICRVGRYKTPEWSSPILARTVEAIGWEALCNTLEEDLPTVRAQFERYLRARTETANKTENFGRLEEHTKRIGAASVGELLRLRKGRGE